MACLTSTLLGLLCLGHALHAADLKASISSPANISTAVLNYQEASQTIINWAVAVTLQTAPFKNEPAAAAGKTVRGFLNFGGESGNSNAIAFVWQRDAGKLFLDLNRNQDLTDDPAGMISGQVSKPLYYQTFNNLHLPFNTAAGQCQVLADLSFYDYGSRPNCTLAVRSFWQGKVTLQGRDWQAGIVQNVLKSADLFAGGELLLRPWEKRNEPFTANGNAPDAFPFASKLFLAGQAYQLDLVVGSQQNVPSSALKFTEQSVALGELKITGTYIKRLVLSGGPYLMQLDSPTDTVKVPVGSYRQPRIQLAQNGTEAVYSSSQIQFNQPVSVNAGTPTVLNIGGPLTNSVIVSRHGEDLRLDYRLVGAGGETYQLTAQNRSQPPEFAVFKGGKKIASGKFEFG